MTSDDSKHDDNTISVGGESKQKPAGGSTNDVSDTLIPHGTESLVIGAPTDPFASQNPESIVNTIAGQAITAANTAIAIPGTMVKPGEPGITLRVTLVALDTSGQLVVGSKTIPIPTSIYSGPFTTTVGGRVIAATSATITIAGTTLGPGDAGVSVNGTLLSLDTAGHFVVGSKTQTFGSETTGVFGIEGPFAAVAATLTGGNVANETGKRNGTGTGVQAFEGKAEDMISSMRIREVAAVIYLIVLFMHV